MFRLGSDKLPEDPAKVKGGGKGGEKTERTVKNTLLLLSQAKLNFNCKGNGAWQMVRNFFLLEWVNI